MKQTKLITTYIQTRLESFNLPADEIEWAVHDLASGVSLERVDTNDALYANAVNSKSYVAFYGDIPTAYASQYIEEALATQYNYDACAASLAKGTTLHVVNRNGVPQVIAKSHSQASIREQFLMDVFVDFLNTKLTDIRKMLTSEIEQIVSTGVHLHASESDKHVKLYVNDIINHFFDFAKSA